MKAWARRHPFVFFLLLHVAVVALFFSPAILIRGIVVPAELLHSFYPWAAYFQNPVDHNTELPDVILQFYPWFLRWGEEIRSGHWPLWNADSGLGLPFAANPQTASFFPLTFLALLGPWAWTLVLASRLVVAGAAAFLWLRSLGRSRGASTLGGFAFAYSLPFVTWLAWPHANVNMLLPLLLLWAVRLARAPGPGARVRTRRSRSSRCTSAVTRNRRSSTSSPPCSSGRSRCRRRRWRKLARSGVFLALGGVLGTLAAAIHLVPFLEYFAKSRVLLEPGARVARLAKSWLVTWIVPLFYGRPMDGTKWPDHRGSWTRRLSPAPRCCAWRDCDRHGSSSPDLPILAFGFFPYAWLTAFRRSRSSGPPAARPDHDAPVPAHRRACRRDPGSVRLGSPPRARPGAETARRLAPLRRAGAPRSRRGRRHPRPRPRGAGATAPRDRRAGDAPRSSLPLRAASPRAPLVSRESPSDRRGFGLLTFDLWHAAFDYHGAVDRGLSFFPTRLTDFLRRDAGRSRVVPLGRLMPPNLNLPYDIPSVMSYDAIDSLEQAIFLRKLGGYDAERLFSPVDPRRLANPRVAELAALKYWLDDPLSPAARHPGIRKADGLPVLARLRPARRAGLRAGGRALARAVLGAPPLIRASGVRKAPRSP